MKTKLYEYDVVTGTLNKTVVKSLRTRQKARDFKRKSELKNPQVKHRIIQRQYDISYVKEIR